ncbi:MAG: PHP domain-containing protein [Andreesenia angusta]|nr:PHP domain-containing protein [Andreesenia angusta]
MFKADMHVHTTASDGLLSPTEVIRWASKKEINAIAITDHDTVKGIEEAIDSGKRYGVKVIPGVEMSCIYKESEVHIVGLFIDHNDKKLNDKFKELSESRTKRGKKIISNLREIGIDIDYDELLKEANCDSIGKPHIARLLIKKNYAEDMQDAFKKYLLNGKPGDVERAKILVPEAIELIKSVNGIAIIAHPGLIKRKVYPLELLRYNPDGMEVLHSIHDKHTIERIGKIVREKNLLKSAGSDCHGNLYDGIPILGDFYLNRDEYEAILKKHLERKIENGKK